MINFFKGVFFVLSVYRNELKYLLSWEQAVQLEDQISQVLEPDEFSSEGVYRVKSLYFDTVYDADFNSRYYGEYYRKKIRLRIYDENEPFAKLELKEKEDHYQHKTSLTLSRDQAVRIMDGDYGLLLDLEEEAALRLYSLMMGEGYRPVVIIEYDRRAFVYPLFHTRITFDSAIKSSEMELDLYQKELPWTYVSSEQVVLEVKYDQQLPPFLSGLFRKYSLSRLSVSKYGIGRPIYQEYIF